MRLSTWGIAVGTSEKFCIFQPSIIPAPSSNDPPREDSASLGQASDVSAESEKSQIFHPHVDSTLAMKSSYILDELVSGYLIMGSQTPTEPSKEKSYR